MPFWMHGTVAHTAGQQVASSTRFVQHCWNFLLLDGGKSFRHPLNSVGHLCTWCGSLQVPNGLHILTTEQLDLAYEGNSQASVSSTDMPLAIAVANSSEAKNPPPLNTWVVNS